MPRVPSKEGRPVQDNRVVSRVESAVRHRRNSTAGGVGELVTHIDLRDTVLNQLEDANRHGRAMSSAFVCVQQMYDLAGVRVSPEEQLELTTTLNEIALINAQLALKVAKLKGEILTNKSVKMRVFV